ncbi:hypothetical protein [Streptomyces sp. NPDC017260]|uniref:hypothetical protein n=1 Tax=unclassified Streptomyces TaxID=2593676 RepID=UPI0037A0C729
MKRFRLDMSGEPFVAFDPSTTDRWFHVAAQDRGREQTPGRAAEMRARGWQDVDEHRWWRT